MKKDFDVIIIGAGIIGCCTAFELSKKGLKTLNIDKLSAVGSGSTANSCAVIRVHYSTLDGTAVAYESYLYWNEWEKYLGVKDPQGAAQIHIRVTVGRLPNICGRAERYLAILTADADEVHQDIAVQCHETDGVVRFIGERFDPNRCNFATCRDVDWPVGIAYLPEDNRVGFPDLQDSPGLDP